MSNFIDELLHRWGYLKEDELVIRAYPKEEQRKLRSLAREMLVYRNNPIKLSELGLEYRKTMRKAAPHVKSQHPRVKDAIRGVSSFGPGFNGYKPAAAQTYGLFDSFPFGIYAFFARNHWAVKACLQVIRNEIINDGWELRTSKPSSKKRLRQVHQILKDNDIYKLRVNIAHHLKLYGNAYVLPHTNLMGGPGGFELLAPSHINYVVNLLTDEITHYDYVVGTQTFQYPVDKVLHIYDFSVDEYKQIGDPTLEAAVLAMEADLNADSYNNQIFSKSGLMGLILNVETPDTDPIGGEDEAFVEELQDRIDAQFSGLKAANSVLVTNNLKDVHNVSPIGKLDAAFQVLHTETAKTVANCMGIPPEKISVPRTPHLQYVPAVDEMITDQFNKTLNALLNKVDDFINERILKECLNIKDTRIVCADRYGGFTLTAAQTLKTLSEAGPIATVNLALERLGQDTLPPDDPRGLAVLDNSANRDMNAVPGPYARARAPEDLNLDKSFANKRIRKWVSSSWEDDEEVGIVNVLKCKPNSETFFLDS